MKKENEILLPDWINTAIEEIKANNEKEGNFFAFINHDKAGKILTYCENNNLIYNWETQTVEPETK